MTEALVADSISVRGGQRALLANVNVRADYGSLLAVVGPNGAGKSTLLRALAGLLAHGGLVRVAGKLLSDLSIPARARLIGYVPQRSAMSGGSSVYDVVAQARFAHRSGFGFSRTTEPAVERALDLTELLPLRARAYDTLSGGEQRRVLIARALASEARILLLDEPTAGLDVGYVLRFYALLATLRSQGYALVCALHDLSDVRRHADRTLLLRQGESVGLGPSAEVLSAANLRAVYGVHAHELAAPGFSLNGTW